MTTQMRGLFISIVGFLILLGSACDLPDTKKPSANSGNNGTPSNEEIISKVLQGVDEMTNEMRELSKPNKVQAWVNNLQVKAQPGKEMPQVATLKEGEIAEYLYQRTIRKSEMMLRDQRYIESWILIRTTDGVMGWVHEGGVRYIEPDFFSLLSGEAGQQNTGTKTRGLNDDPVNPANHLIVPGRRVGPIQYGTTEQDLARIYGVDRIARGTVQKSAKESLPCTIVMPGGENELRISWKDTLRTKIAAVYFDKPHAKWMTAQGLRVGLPLDELTKANKSPLGFHGFNWEYAGVVASWRKGVFESQSQGFYVALSPAPSAPASLVKKFSGSEIYSTNAEDIDALGLYVSRLVVYLD